MAAAGPSDAGDLSQLVSAGPAPAAGSGAGAGSLAAALRLGTQHRGGRSGPASSAGSAARPSRGSGGEAREAPAPRPGRCGWLGRRCPRRAAARGTRIRALYFPLQADNLLHQLQEDFQALTEKIALRNILFERGLPAPRGRFQLLRPRSLCGTGTGVSRARERGCSFFRNTQLRCSHCRC